MKSHGSTAARVEADRIVRLAEQGRIGSLLRRREEPLDVPVLLLLKEEVERLVRIDARRALQLASVMERLLPLIADPMGRAVASRAKAEALLCLGRYQKALETYQRTIRLYTEGGDLLEGARTSVAEIHTLASLSRYGEALRVADRAEGVLRRHGERVYLGRLFMNKGNLFFHMDRYRQALANYRKARRYLEAVCGRDETVVGLEINEGVIHTNLDEMRDAERCLDRAVSRARKMGWHALVAQGEFNLARVYYLASRYQEALATLTSSSAVFEGVDRSLAAIADATRAEIYLRLNMASEAAPLARRALSRFRLERMRCDEALALYTLGIALGRQGRLTEGKRRLLGARSYFQREGNRVRTAVIDLHLARLLARAERWNEARRRAALAARALEHERLPARAALARLARAEVELLSGRPRAAERILAGLPRLTDRLARFERGFLRGRIAEERGQRSRALAAYRRAAALADTVRVALVGEEHKIAVEGFRADVTDRAVSLLLRPPRRSRSASRRRVSRGDSRVFELVEGARSRALADLLAGLSRERGPGRSRASNSVGERLAIATRELAWYSAKLEREVLGGGVAAGKRARLAREAARCEREVTALHRRSREMVPAGRRHDRSAKPISLEMACRMLGDDETVVEYFAEGDNLYAFRIERGGARIVTLPASIAETERLVSRFLFEIDTKRLAGPSLGSHAASLQQSVSRCLRELYEKLVEPLGEIAAETKLTVVPHGGMHRIPFAALEDDDGPIGARACVALAPSFEILSGLRERPASSRRRDLVGGHADPSAPQIGCEIDAVADAIGKRGTIVSHSLGADEFLRLAPRARRIHLATHGHFRWDNPLFSAVRLADRWVYLYEILNLDLDADLVVLSGCETGAGRRFAGEEILGLARGFLARGARRLVVSLWPVDDPSAARLASHLHEQMARRVRPREALRKASLRIREESSHPYHWSPFVMIGSGPDERAR